MPILRKRKNPKAKRELVDGLPGEMGDAAVRPGGNSSVWQAVVSRLEGNLRMVDVFRTAMDTLVSILPIVVFLIFFNKGVLKSRLENPLETYLGILLSIVGLVLFVQGLKMGLLPLGENVGRNLPQSAKLWLVLVFAFVVGYGVTLAEPALHALGIQVEELSAGALTKNLVVHTVALGVGVALIGGMLKIVYHVPTAYVLAPIFVFTAILALIAPKTITGVAFDSGGVTTGPVTVPIIISLGVGVTTALGGRDPLMDGFGLIALSSAGPIIALLLLGIIFKM
jgi:hypothetical protein